MNNRCMCGLNNQDCWPSDDFAWLDSQSGWRGTFYGCQTSVFFIHGRKIREQRHVPAGRYDIAILPERFAEWARGLPNARLVWSRDTGDGDAGLWIEGERDADEDDLVRLREARERIERNDRREFERLKAKLSSLHTAAPGRGEETVIVDDAQTHEDTTLLDALRASDRCRRLKRGEETP